MRNKNFHMIAALAMGLGALTTNAIPANATGNNTVQQQSKKDAIQEKHTPIRPQARKRNFLGASDENPYKYNRTPKKNQRQKRKYLRQNPHLRSKYK